MPTNAVQQSLALARQHHQAGRLAEAEALYRQVLAAQPDHAEALQRLGIIALQIGRHDLAAEWIRRATVLQPQDAAAHSNLGECYRRLGRVEEAIASYRRALELDPNLAEVHYNLGNAFADQGQPDRAIAAYRRALELRPDYPGAHHNLGNVLARRAQFDAAAAAYLRAITLRPDDAQHYNALGLTRARQGRFDEALAAFCRALELQPDNPQTHNRLGAELARRGRIDEAIAAYRRAIQLNPHDSEASNSLGAVLAEQGRFDEALAASQRALQLKPDYAVAHYNLATTQRMRGQPDEAVAAFREAIRLQPDLLEAHHNLGLTLAEQGQIEEALAAYRRALEINPDDAGVHSNLIYTLHFHPGQDLPRIAEEQQCWNARFSEPWQRALTPHPNPPEPARRLKIGYVSPDFRSHAVAFFLTPLLEAHDHQSYEIYCYANVLRPDAVTERLRKTADHWRDIRGSTDAQLAQGIRDDGIDILVDLAMHTAGNRLPAFAREPAPIQVSWLAYPGGTGLAAFDYRFTDERLDPPEPAHPSAAEQPAPLPDAWCCYAPIEQFPEVGPLPAAQGKAVTFGSLNQFRKIHDGLLHCWAGLLAAAPATRLLIVCPPGHTQKRTRDFFARQGIAPERIEWVAPCDWAGYLQLFAKIDLALDSFPCNGMTTTCHCLWMGVPVVTLSGTSAIARAGESLLHAAGLPEWVARSEKEYIRIAAEGAADVPRLAELRRTLRPRLKASPLMDAPRFARNVETAYRTIWQRWCATRRS